MALYSTDTFYHCDKELRDGFGDARRILERQQQEYFRQQAREMEMALLGEQSRRAFGGLANPLPSPPSTKPKKPAKLSLREELQAETDQWLKR